MAANEFLADQIVVFRADGSGQIRTLLAQNLRQESQRALSLAQSYTSLEKRSARSAPHAAAASTGPDIMLRAVRMEDIEDRDYRRSLFAAAAEHQWTLTRESSLGLMFAAANVWDGTGVVVITGSGIKPVTDLNGATICVRLGTITELDLADWARRKKISYNPVLIGAINESEEAFL